MELKDRPIGFFDSGVGGISVLKESVKLMPEENYIYFGDSINAPYGEKTTEEVRELTLKAAEFLTDKGCKAIVIACNTATSAAVKELREKYKEVPVIGIEPAIKPAILNNSQGKILIMATPITLREEKFKRLLNKYDKKNNVELIPCAGLAEIIEKGNLQGEEVRIYLKEKLKEYKNMDIEQVVLGCTHYPFIQDEIRNELGEDILMIDGGEGTVKQLKRMLIKFKIKNNSGVQGNIKVINSKSDELVQFCIQLLNEE